MDIYTKYETREEAEQAIVSNHEFEQYGCIYIFPDGKFGSMFHNELRYMYSYIPSDTKIIATFSWDAKNNIPVFTDETVRDVQKRDVISALSGVDDDMLSTLLAMLDDQ